MASLTNEHNIPLSLAVYLATDTYDYDPTCISATKLLKPIRQTILASRIPVERRSVDVLSMVKNRAGHAIHDAVERAWNSPYLHKVLSALGYDSEDISNVAINPSYKPKSNQIAVYMERRSVKEVNGIRVSGKFDFVANGTLEDFKTTSTYSWGMDSKEEDFRYQGSVYRWLNPDIITDPIFRIRFIFSDWMAGKAKNNPNYPQKPIETLNVELLSLDETEAWIIDRLNQLEKYKSSPDSEIPLCSDRELWRRDPEIKYYKDPNKRTRSTKNFNEHENLEDNLRDAYSRHAADGGVGVVVTIPGQVIACRYCAAFEICKQKDMYIADGSLN